MSIVLDKLDKSILHEICNGIHSYDDLAKTLNVTRGTVYRRIEKLEKNHVISKKIMAIPNFGKLNLSAIFVGMNASYDDLEKVHEIIRGMPNVKFLWRAYGAHQIIAVMLCEKGNEGAVINDLNRSLSKLRTSQCHISIGYKWEKTDLSPY